MAVEKKKNLKHRVLEVIEGGLRGNRGAWIFSWTVLILIVLSNAFYLVTLLEEPGPRTEITFTILETVTVVLLTAEVALGFWTADIRYPEEKRPRAHHLRQPMTILGILAVLPFYLGAIFYGSALESAAERTGFLTLLHLAKAWEIMKSSRATTPPED